MMPVEVWDMAVQESAAVKEIQWKENPAHQIAECYSQNCHIASDIIQGKKVGTYQTTLSLLVTKMLF